MINKKVVITVLLAIFLTATLSPSIAGAEDSSEKNQIVLGFIDLAEISIQADPETVEKPVESGSSGTKTIDLKVGFKLNLGSLTKRFFFKRRIHINKK